MQVIAALSVVWYGGTIPMAKLPAQLDHFYAKAFLRSRIFFFGTLAALTLNVGVWALFVVKFAVLYQPDRDFIALHYKVFYGVDLYSNWYYLFTLPVAGLVTIIVNYWIARVSHHTLSFLSTLLTITSVGAQVGLYFAVWLILQINIY